MKNKCYIHIRLWLCGHLKSLIGPVITREPNIAAVLPATLVFLQTHLGT